MKLLFSSGAADPHSDTPQYIELMARFTSGTINISLRLIPCDTFIYSHSTTPSDHANGLENFFLLCVENFSRLTLHFILFRLDHSFTSSILQSLLPRYCKTQRSRLFNRSPSSIKSSETDLQNSFLHYWYARPIFHKNMYCTDGSSRRLLARAPLRLLCGHGEPAYPIYSFHLFYKYLRNFRLTIQLFIEPLAKILVAGYNSVQDILSEAFKLSVSSFGNSLHLLSKVTSLCKRSLNDFLHTRANNWRFFTTSYAVAFTLNFGWSFPEAV